VARAIVRIIWLGALILSTTFGAVTSVHAASDKVRYQRMAPIELYLIADRDAEVALARSAAPDSISRDADVLVLGPHGYETAIKGTNGFVCLVDRGWTSDVDDPEFMNPELREPICFNAAAARSHLPLTFKQTEWAMAGQDRAQMRSSIKAAYERKELPAPEPGGMSYMMSNQTYFGPTYGKGRPHLMFYLPKTDSMAWGGGMTGSPVIVHQDDPEPTTTFVIPVSKYSDGSAAPSHDH
jgi:hypothetical protein